MATDYSPQVRNAVSDSWGLFLQKSLTSIFAVGATWNVQRNYNGKPLTNSEIGAILDEEYGHGNAPSNVVIGLYRGIARHFKGDMEAFEKVVKDNGFRTQDDIKVYMGLKPNHARLNKTGKPHNLQKEAVEIMRQKYDYSYQEARTAIADVIAAIPPHRLAEVAYRRKTSGAAVRLDIPA